MNGTAQKAAEGLCFSRWFCGSHVVAAVLILIEGMLGSVVGVLLLQMLGSAAECLLVSRAVFLI